MLGRQIGHQDRQPRAMRLDARALAEAELQIGDLRTLRPGAGQRLDASAPAMRSRAQPDRSNRSTENRQSGPTMSRALTSRPGPASPPGWRPFVRRRSPRLQSSQTAPRALLSSISLSQATGHHHVARSWAGAAAARLPRPASAQPCRTTLCRRRERGATLPGRRVPVEPPARTPFAPGRHGSGPRPGRASTGHLRAFSPSAAVDRLAPVPEHQSHISRGVRSLRCGDLSRNHKDSSC